MTIAAEPPRPVAVVTGAAVGLGFHIASALADAGYSVALLGRNTERLQQAKMKLHQACPGALLEDFSADLTQPNEVAAIFPAIVNRFGRIDVLVNNVGLSDRGTVQQLQPDHLVNILQTNLLPPLLCSQAAASSIESTGGSIINIGSLAAKVGARYLGGYPAAKHALAGLTQQMRLEWKPRGIHVGLINPGPIRRDDAGVRYADRVAQDADLPAAANQPGGGAKVKGVAPERVAQQVLKMIRRRTADVIIPAHLRPLVAIGHISPSFGDWLLLKFTSGKAD